MRPLRIACRRRLLPVAPRVGGEGWLPFSAPSAPPPFALPLVVPYSLLPVPYSLFPIPCSLFPIPYSLFPIPYSLFPIPCSLFPIPYSLLYGQKA